jgi:uncharacterized protein
LEKQNHYINSSKEALLLLKAAGCSDDVIKHSLAVSQLALKIGKKVKENSYKIDLKFLKMASLLHDIGRSKTHGISHGIEGGKILRKFNFPEEFARVCENHLGAGISKEEARKVGLPPRDFIPETLEEKIIAHADNLIEKDKVLSLEKTIKKLKIKLGENHPAISRVISLAEEIDRLTSKSKSK